MKRKLVWGSLIAVTVYIILAVVAWLIVPKMIADSEGRLFGVRIAIARLEQDQILLSQRIQAVIDQTLGKGRQKEEEVAALLADPDINHLALVYLGADWVIQRSELVGVAAHMRNLFNQQKKDRNKTLNRLDQREDEILQKVKKLERRKRGILAQMPLMNRGSSSYKSAIDELDEVDRQLFLYMDRRVYLETKRSNDVQRDKMDETFAEARAKTEAEIFRLASEYESKTVGTLARVMAEKLGELRFEANKPTHLRRFMSPFNIWPVNQICQMPLEGEYAKQL